MIHFFSCAIGWSFKVLLIMVKLSVDDVMKPRSLHFFRKKGIFPSRLGVVGLLGFVVGRLELPGGRHHSGSALHGLPARRESGLRGVDEKNPCQQKPSISFRISCCKKLFLKRIPADSRMLSFGSTEKILCHYAPQVANFQKPGNSASHWPAQWPQVPFVPILRPARCFFVFCCCVCAVCRALWPKGPGWAYFRNAARSRRQHTPLHWGMGPANGRPCPSERGAKGCFTELADGTSDDWQLMVKYFDSEGIFSLVEGQGRRSVNSLPTGFCF